MKSFLLEYSRKYEIKIKIVQHHDKVSAMQAKFKANFKNMDKRYQIIDEAIQKKRTAMTVGPKKNKKLETKLRQISNKTKD